MSKGKLGLITLIIVAISVITFLGINNYFFSSTSIPTEELDNSVTPPQEPSFVKVTLEWGWKEKDQGEIINQYSDTVYDLKMTVIPGTHMEKVDGEWERVRDDPITVSLSFNLTSGEHKVIDLNVGWFAVGSVYGYLQK